MQGIIFLSNVSCKSARFKVRLINVLEKLSLQFNARQKLPILMSQNEWPNICSLVGGSLNQSN